MDRVVEHLQEVPEVAATLAPEAPTKRDGPGDGANPVGRPQIAGGHGRNGRRHLATRSATRAAPEKPRPEPAEAEASESSSSNANQRIEELRRIIKAYNDVTDKLQRSHTQLQDHINRLHEELSEKNRILERRNRLAALGEMAAGMAHEIRNPLGGIQLYASLLAQDVEDRPASYQLVEKIAGGVKRLEAVVGQVLHFTREISPNMTEANLADVVSQAVDLTSRQRTHAGVVCLVEGPPRMMVTVDPLLLGQALLNLLLNGIEAMASWAGPRRLRVSYGVPDPSGPARKLLLSVGDTGPGISPAILDRIFNPFFTTKESGTGLGLSIVHRVVEAHEGTIVVSNSPEGGTAFNIRI
jgi:signal transduction histidine kinase